MYGLPYCDLAASLANPPHASPWYDDGNGGIPRTGPLHCRPDSDLKSRTAREPGRTPDRATLEIPQKARRVDVHKA